MPDQFRFSIDLLLEEIGQVEKAGIHAIILFGLPKEKDAIGSQAYAIDGIIQRALRSIKKTFPDIVVITDVCLCEYTDHGHCGFIRDNQIDNDESTKLLAEIALSHAQAGADIVAPSAMMDGQVAEIRKKLDENGFQETGIMAYSAKFSSAFYGPFREAADSCPKFGDRKSYQMDMANGREALREVELDIAEGADMVMIKPALPFLDVIYRVRQICHCPIVAYNVSGEYAIIKAGGSANWIDYKEAMLECMICIKRAGADLIITYFAKELAKYLNEVE